jgi:hypothetical protein
VSWILKGVGLGGVLELDEVELEGMPVLGGLFIVGITRCIGVEGGR